MPTRGRTDRHVIGPYGVIDPIEDDLNRLSEAKRKTAC